MEVDERVEIQRGAAAAAAAAAVAAATAAAAAEATATATDFGQDALDLAVVVLQSLVQAGLALLLHDLLPRTRYGGDATARNGLDVLLRETDEGRAVQGHVVHHFRAQVVEVEELLELFHLLAKLLAEVPKGHFVDLLKLLLVHDGADQREALALAGGKKEGVGRKGRGVE